MSGSRLGRVAVVGGGIAGAASAWALARRGFDVVLAERYEPGHGRGGSHGATRIFRLTYPDAELVRLAQESLPGWRLIERETGQRLLQFTGLLEAAPDLAPYAAALDACGVRWDELSAGAVAERFGIRLPAGTTALLEHEAGVVHAGRALEAFLAAARARGLRVAAGTHVRALEPTAGGVGLATEGDTLECDAVVVAAGAWARALLEPLGIALPLTVTRETVVYFRRGGKPPSLIDEHAPPAGRLGYALFDPVYGLKAGFHHSGVRADPDEPGAPDAAVAAAATAWVRERYPDVGAPAAVETCLYANLPGERFALERHGRVVVTSACSGHGFKFAPAVGERVAELVAEALG